MSQANQIHTTSARAEAMRRDKMRILAKRLPVTEAEIGGAMRLTVDARALHGVLGILREFGPWVRDRIAANRMERDSDYALTGGGAKRPCEYRLATDAAKALCFGACSMHGGLVRRYLADAERVHATATREAIERGALSRMLADAMARLEAKPPVVLPAPEPARRNQAERAMHPDELVMLDAAAWHVGMSKRQVCAAMAEMGWMVTPNAEIPTTDGLASGAVAMLMVDRAPRLALTQDGLDRLKQRYAHAA